MLSPLHKKIIRSQKVLNWLVAAYISIKLFRGLKYLTANKHIAQLMGIARPTRALPEDGRLSQFFQNKQGLWLFTHKWFPPEGMEVKASVFLCHGFGEHAGRYHHIAKYFTARGYAVFALDYQGHGRSEGDRAYVEQFSDYVEDALQWMQWEGRETPTEAARAIGKPRLLLGHSMGGAVAILLAQACKRSGVRLDGAVLSGPAIKASPDVAKPHLVMAAGFLAKWVPKLPLEPLDVEKVARSSVTIQSYSLDPLNYTGGMKARVAHQFLVAFKAIEDTVTSFDLPFLVCHGEEDPLCLPEGSRFFYENAASTDKDIRFIPSERHEILNEDSWEETVGYMEAWMRKRISFSY